MNFRRVKMLNMALCLVQEETNKLFQWMALEMMPSPSPEALSQMEDLVDEDLLRDFDAALTIYAEARNSLSDERDLNVPTLVLEFSPDTFLSRSQELGE